jgi:hypothetical protein
MQKLIAVVGGLIICAGIDLLWQSRSEIPYWLDAYRGFIVALWKRQLPSRILVSAEAFFKRQAAVQVLLGLGFALVVGPLLLAVSLTLMLYPR